MTLLKGQVLLFKGKNAQIHCDDVERDLKWRCTRKGNEIRITINTRLKIDDSIEFEIVEPPATAKKE